MIGLNASSYKFFKCLVVKWLKVTALMLNQAISMIGVSSNTFSLE